MEMFRRSIVFLTPDNIASVIMKTPFASTAWDLANLYLLSCGAEPLSKEAPELVGLSEETTCYVSTAYFRSENRLDDFVVHEAAHVFHNCKRETIGLPTIRGREWLLEIDYRKRELFAYACEAYSCIAHLAARRLLGRPCSRRSRLTGYHLTTESMSMNIWPRSMKPSMRAMDGSAFWKDAGRLQEGVPNPGKAPKSEAAQRLKDVVVTKKTV
jgi:hypothetical protein